MTPMPTYAPRRAVDASTGPVGIGIGRRPGRVTARLLVARPGNVQALLLAPIAGVYMGFAVAAEDPR